MTIPVQIGIVVYNSLADLPRCFEGVRQQTHANLRITVFDNASSDASVSWLRENAPDVEITVSSQNLGFGRGHNVLVRQRHLGEYYLALNPDIYLHPGYVAALAAALSAEARAGWGIGKLLLPDGVHIYSVGHALFRSGYAINVGHGLADSPAFAVSREVFGAPGAAVMLRDSLIDAISPPFDEHIFLYAEDTDLDWRARRLGWKCFYAAEAVALHRGSTPDALRSAEAVANRYLSVLKNAYLPDLLIYNLLVLGAHVLVRCILTPRLGLHIAWVIASGALVALRQRQPAVLSRPEMHHWFAWAKQQPTSQPTTLRARLRKFLQR